MPAQFQTPGEPQRLDEIQSWHRDIVEALLEHRASVQKTIRLGTPVPPRFVGMTESDVEAYFDDRRRELDRLTMLNLVASAEAAIKADYFRRINGKRKDKEPLAKAYQEWHKDLDDKKKRRPNFDRKGIIDVLKQTGLVDKHIIGRFRDCLRVRHWIGHGRSWTKPIQVDRLDPDDVYNRADALLQALPA